MLRGSLISSMQLGNYFLQLAYFAGRRKLENEFIAALAGEGLNEVEIKQDQQSGSIRAALKLLAACGAWDRNLPPIVVR